MQKGRERKPNNQGLTLLELLIAVIILAIIVIPFLNSFVISANTNSRAAKTHRATTVAQNLVEGFKAGSVADIVRQMNYPQSGFSVISPDSLSGSPQSSVYELTRISGTGGTEYIKSLSSEEIAALHPGADEKALRKEFLNCDGSDGNARRNSTFSADGGNSWEFVPQYNTEKQAGVPRPPEEGKYYFAIKGIRVQGSTFDALVSLDSGKYKSSGPVAADKQYNEKETVQIMGMDDTKDAIFVQTAAIDREAVEWLKNTYSEKAAEIKTENLRRKITISIEAAGDAKPVHEVKINYTYTFIPDPSITFGEKKDYRIFNNSETGEELRAVYLYYFPWYNASEEDTIEIDNGVDSSGNTVGAGSLPVKLYIVKQESGKPSELLEKENNYRALLYIRDKQPPGVTEDKAVHESLRTNLEENLYQKYVPAGSVLPAPAVRYQWNTRFINPSEADVKKEKLKWSIDMAGSQAQDRIYELSVKIYEEGAADNHFPEEDRIAEITAERND